MSVNNEELVQQFIRYITFERCLSKNTQEAYGRDLSTFCKYIEANGGAFDKVTAINFLQNLRSHNYSSSSCARVQIALKVFFRFLFREEYLVRDEGLFLDAPKLWQKVPEVLTHDELQRLFQVVSTNLRDTAILELLYGTGIRVSELCSLTLYDVEDSSIIVRGKGDKQRQLPLGPRALQAIDAYLNQERSQYESDTNQALFVSNRGKAIDRILVWQMVKRCAKLAKISKEISPHTLRHTYATHLLDGGADIRIIQELLGHAHISSTDRYTHLSRSQIEQRFFACHPRK